MPRADLMRIYHYDAMRAHLFTHPHILITSAPLHHTPPHSMLMIMRHHHTPPQK
jgi:hypothetical protein